MAKRPYEELTWRGQVRRLSALARAGLAEFGLEAERLTCQGHWENSTFRADLTRDLRPKSRTHHPRRVLVRVHRPGYQTAATISSELDWLEAIQGHARLAAPIALRTRSGERVIPVSDAGVPRLRQVSLLRWLPGPVVSATRRGLEDDRLLGETLALLHEQARAWRRPKGFRRRRKGAAGMFGVKRGLAELEEAIARVPRVARRRLERGLEIGWKAIDDAEWATGKLLLIHSDLHEGNLIRHRSHVAVIDFDDCGVGSAALDMAIALHGARHREDWPARRAAFAEGHRRVCPLDPAQLEELEGLFVARTADWLLWASARAVENPGFRAKLVAWAAETVRRLRSLGC